MNNWIVGPVPGTYAERAQAAAAAEQQLHRTQAETKPCPRCRAAAGNPCTGKPGDTTLAPGGYHRARRQRWLTGW